MDDFYTILPRDKNLRKHIAYYYFHESENENFKKDIVYHPHYLSALNVYSNVKIQWSSSGKTYLPIASNAKEVILTVNNKTSKEVKLRGAFSKIGIVFNPLGINHFIKAPLSTLMKSSRASNFNYFGDDFITTADLVFHSRDFEIKGDILDTFFKGYFREFEDKRLLKAVDLILNSSKIPRTQDIADSLGISRKTLLRLFKTHMCFTVEEFKSVVKFRKALSHYEKAIAKPRLSHVAYDNKYYDQSDFINHFKAITGLNPKKFFATIRDISAIGTYWTVKED